MLKGYRQPVDDEVDRSPRVKRKIDAEWLHWGMSIRLCCRLPAIRRFGGHPMTLGAALSIDRSSVRGSGVRTA
jgi:hypothetical protein